MKNKKNNLEQNIKLIRVH